MKRFEIKYEITVVLDVGELWPDGDGPQNPTSGDVIDLIHRNGGFSDIIKDWNLEQFGDIISQVVELTDLGAVSRSCESAR